MRTYLHLFLNLLIPLSILSILASIGYFTLDYDLSKAIKLGVITGVLIGTGIALILSLILLALKKVQKPKSQALHDKSEHETTVTEKDLTQNATPKPKVKEDISKEIRCMLLMDKALSFEVLLNAIRDQSPGTVSAKDTQKGTISIQTKNGRIDTTITSLTKHTSQIVLRTANHDKQIKKLLSYIKEKEHSFLQY